MAVTWVPDGQAKQARSLVNGVVAYMSCWTYNSISSVMFSFAPPDRWRLLLCRHNRG